MVLTRINTISATTLLIPLLLTGFKGDIIDYEDDTEDFISSFVESDEKSTIFFIEDLTKSRVDINPLIKGGEETAIEIYPFVVSIQYRGNHKCGGVIIERNVVLTAAHCIAANIKGWEVLAGTTDLLNNEKGQRLKVESSLKHPDHVHNSTVLLNDIGLIWLNDCLTWSDSIKPAKLSQTWPLNLRPVKARLYVATTIGWGRQSNDSGVHSAVLRRVEQPLTPEEVCLNSLKTEEVKDAYVSQMFCFDDMGTGSCEGDSGGPVVFNNEIIGIVSHSIGQRSCKASVKWKVKISPYYTWIKELMDKGYKCSINQSEVSIEVFSSTKKVSVTVNGTRVTASRNSDRGIHVVVLNEATGSLVTQRCFDTYAPDQDEAMIQFLMNVIDGRILTFAIQDEASGHLRKFARNYLADLGSKYSNLIGRRDMWIFVTTKRGIPLGERFSKNPVPWDINLWAEPAVMKYIISIGKFSDQSKASVEVFSSKKKVSVTVNGTQVTASRNSDRGIHVVVLNEATGSLVTQRCFDTYAPDQDEAMIQFLMNVTDGRILTFASQDDASGHLRKFARNYLADLGSKYSNLIGRRDMWIFVTTKGGIPLGERFSKNPVPSDINLWAEPAVMKYIISIGKFSDQSKASVEVFSSKKKVSVTVNGTQVTASRNSDRGIHVVVLNEATGSLVTQRCFDTYAPDQDEAMIQFLMNVTDGRILTFAIQDEASEHLRKISRNYLADLGSKYSNRIGWRDMWVFMTTKGGKPLGESLSKNLAPWDPNLWAEPAVMKYIISIGKFSVHRQNWQQLRVSGPSLVELTESFLASNEKCVRDTIHTLLSLLVPSKLLNSD